MEQGEFDRLQHLVEMGDKAAAEALFAEAQRRGDLVVARKAAEMMGDSRRAVRRYRLDRTAKLRQSAQPFANELNPQQLAVVTAGAGPLLVIAGAGSGKTRTLTYRVAYMLQQGVAPESILLLTFTNKAAREMLRRVGDLVGAAATRVWGGTFHSVGHRILRRHAQVLGYPERFNIMDGEDCATLMGVCIADLGIDQSKRRFPKGGVVQRIYSMAVNTVRSIEQVVNEEYPAMREQVDPIREVCAQYVRRKLTMGLMDYDDLLINWRRLFAEHPEIGREYGTRFEHVLVDEYQDTNTLQGDIIDLCAQVHRNVMVVGDDCQSIFAFRGANFENILRFPERYTDTRRFLLEINYRSTPEILAIANTSIAFNTRRFDKTLQAMRGTGVIPAQVPCRDMEQQADFVTERILELHESGVPLRNIAVLYRAHYQSVELQVALSRGNIPFSLRSGIRFFEQAHVKDVVSHLRFVHNPRDELSFTRIVKLCPRIGDRFAGRLWETLNKAPDPFAALANPQIASILPAAARQAFARLGELLSGLAKPEHAQAPGAMVGLIIDGDYADYAQSTFRNAENRLSDLEQLARYAAQFDTLEAFLNDLALVSAMTGEDIAEGGAPEDYVVLSTVHQAKGLEWPMVFVTSLWEGGFPTARGLETREAEEEERRLFYVAVTRAMDELYMTYPVSRRDRDGWHRVLRASPFLDELSTPPALGVIAAELTETWALGE